MSMPRLGKLRLGEKKVAASGKAYPAETDFFRLDPDQHMAPEQRQDLIDRFTAAYGERPQILRNVFFPSDDKDFVFPNGLEWWGKSEAGAKLLCQGNGVEASRLVVSNGAWIPRPCCQAAECAEWAAGKCKLMSRLRIFLPEITVAGYFQIDTGSVVGTGNVLDLINHLLTMFGRLTSIPLVLSREPKPITYEGKVTTHYVLVMRAPNVSLTEFKQLVAQNANQMLLTAGDVELEVPEEDVPEELIPTDTQEPEPDADLMKKIAAGFDALGTTQANRLVHLQRFKGREVELLREINSRVDAAAAKAETKTGATA